MAESKPGLRYVMFSPADYLADTRDLTLAEHGTYLLMMCRYWVSGEPLPDNLQTIARQLGLKRPTSVQRVAARFFDVGDDGLLHHKRIDRDLAKYHQRAPHREVAQAALRTRQDKYRADRAWLFQALRERGVVPAFNTPMRALRKLARKLGIEPPVPEQINGTPHHSSLQTIISGGYLLEESPMASHNASSHDLPIGENQNQSSDGVASRLGGADRDAVALQISEYLGGLGIPGCKPTDNALLKLVEQGAVLRDFKAPAGEAAVRHKDWPFVCYRVQYKLAMRQRNPGAPSVGAPSDDGSTSENEP